MLAQSLGSRFISIPHMRLRNSFHKDVLFTLTKDHTRFVNLEPWVHVIFYICTLHQTTFLHWMREKHWRIFCASCNISNFLRPLTDVAICLNMKVAGGEIYLYVCAIYLRCNPQNIHAQIFHIILGYQLSQDSYKGDLVTN